MSELLTQKKTYFATKTYGNDRGLSCVFRQWRATDSHCSLLHGYSIGVQITMGANSLDTRNWTYDFGGFKGLETWLKDTFDHTLVVSKDDPYLKTFQKLESEGLVKLITIAHVGCEKFAELIFNKMEELLSAGKTSDPDHTNEDAWVESVTVFEHGSNSATFKKEYASYQ